MNITGKITKRDDDRFLVFGYASVADVDGNAVVDSQGDTISIVELEKAAYDFVRFSGTGGEMHDRIGVADLVESIVFTPEKLEALGLAKDALPHGWWIGMKVTDAEVWQKIKNGEYSMFSIGGHAVRSEVNE